MLSFFLRGVLDEILNLIVSVSEGFPSYSSTYVSPVCLCIHSNVSILIPLYNQNVRLRCLVNDLLELPIEVVNLSVIMSRKWCIDLYDGDIERSCFQMGAISLLDTGRHPKTALAISLCSRKPKAKFSLAQPIPLKAVYASIHRYNCVNSINVFASGRVRGWGLGRGQSYSKCQKWALFGNRGDFPLHRCLLKTIILVYWVS